MPDFEEYCEEIRELWDSRIITNMGVKRISENVITLPMYADLPLEEVDRICETIV